MLHQFLTASEQATDQITVSAEILGGRMHHHIGTQLKRSGQCRRGISVVDHADGTFPAGNIGASLYVNQAHVGIRRRFEIHHLAAWVDDRSQGIGVGHVNVGDLYTKAFQPGVHELEGTAVQCLISNDFITGADQAPQQRADRAHARGCGQSGCGTFQAGNALFQQSQRGIGDACINMTALFAGKQCRALLGTGKSIGRTQMQRRHQRARLIVAVVTVMYGASGEAGGVC